MKRLEFDPKYEEVYDLGYEDGVTDGGEKAKEFLYKGIALLLDELIYSINDDRDADAVRSCVATISNVLLEGHRSEKESVIHLYYKMGAKDLATATVEVLDNKEYLDRFDIPEGLATKFRALFDGMMEDAENYNKEE